MRPGALFDCELPGCVPTTGGLCAFVPNTPMWWCCLPYDSSCWSAPKLCNYTETDELVSQILCKVPAPGSSWCCDSMFESCPPDLTVQRCAPLNFPNPVLDGPLLGASAVETTPPPTYPSRPSATIVSTANISGMPWTAPRKHTNPAVIGAGVVVTIALAVSGAYLLWRHLRGKAETGALAEPMPEVCGETRPIRELSGEMEPQELDSVSRHELCAAAEKVSRV